MAVDRTFHRHHSRRVLEAGDVVGGGVVHNRDGKYALQRQVKPHLI